MTLKEKQALKSIMLDLYEAVKENAELIESYAELHKKYHGHKAYIGSNNYRLKDINMKLQRLADGK